MKKTKGISLIVLVITIVVVIILVGAIMLNMEDNDLIGQSKEARFKSNVSTYRSELSLALSKQYIMDEEFDKVNFNAGIWEGDEENTEGTIKAYITSISVADGKKFEIQEGKLVYVGTNETEMNWLVDISVGEETGNVEIVTVTDFEYTGQVQTYTVPTSGKYILEVWGAQGGGSLGGKGGYAKGQITLTTGKTLNIYVGQKPTGGTGGWNGGGGIFSGSDFGGGGATDIRLDGTNLGDRIIIAGAGGGAKNTAGGVGGGLNGTAGTDLGTYDYLPGGGATQTSGGASGSSGGYNATAGLLGQGGTGYGSSGGGGGGGYYGGGGGVHWGGGGGSGYVEPTLTNTQLTDGNSLMPNPLGETMTGRIGHGYARITYVR